MADETATSSPAVPPVFTDAQQIKILKLHRKALEIKNTLAEVTAHHAALVKQHAETIVEIDAAVKEVVDAANFDMTGHGFNHELLAIMPVPAPK
jgi:hypothetical protein